MRQKYICYILLILLRFYRIIESQNHRMVRVGRDLKDHVAPTPLP